MKKNLARIATIKDLDLELQSCSDIVQLKSLHYGYWAPDELLTIDNFLGAQVRYTETLLTLIPDGVRTILDVGCGIGDVSLSLAKNGFKVTAISPDKNHQRYFDEYDHNDLKFIETKFESFRTDERFDLILMSESQNYFDMNIGFEQCTKMLVENGYLLVSGNFRKSNSKEFRRITHIENEYIESAEHYGFELLKSIDITDKVLPTAALGELVLKRYISPTLGMLKYYAKNTSPLKFKLIQLVFRKQWKQLTLLLEDWQERADPVLYKNKVKYMRLLFSARSAVPA